MHPAVHQFTGCSRDLDRKFIISLEQAEPGSLAWYGGGTNFGEAGH
jgi:hypothetical protein